MSESQVLEFLGEAAQPQGLGRRGHGSIVAARPTKGSKSSFRIVPNEKVEARRCKGSMSEETPPPTDTRNLNIRIPEDVHKRLKILAAEAGRPSKDVTLDVIHAGLSFFERERGQR